MLFQLLDATLDEMYYNPDVVIIALGLLVAVIIFGILTQTRILGSNRGIIAIISLCIAGIGVFRFQDMIFQLTVFNAFVGLLVLGVIFVIIRAFFNFGSKRFKTRLT